MRMHGSWHIYRLANAGSGRGTSCASCIETPPYVAVAFAVPVAEFVAAGSSIARARSPNWGRICCRDTFDAPRPCARLAARPDLEIADALLDQRALAGIGNVFKSEVLFAARVSPFTQRRGAFGRAAGAHRRDRRAADARQRRARRRAGRRTTNRLDPSARLWVYGRRGLPCRRCGAPIQRAKQGPDARSTYWCERCQPRLRASGLGLQEER